ncbi:extracellular catalytic domain type 1 short-chain-length polyhydroxyalkanoate depolymerase [Pseudoxanthomonas sacheonensis]|uniref:Poly(Hydroxyalkanoate) depolymerase family esterase n=1 Tax=Pseudoxanthomonas sacheonensis TaxID=443615 RepID=A0ABU1RQB5_9GAMM|nr:PHB depolymerase family esterase [Pseudoxanthomonas sacheonensis]MDR6840969.1 poly(hydroxyalkanoate) depolymerase family esterase [Pseudoxanthomonas sacheonensis]
MSVLPDCIPLSSRPGPRIRRLRWQAAAFLAMAGLLCLPAFAQTEVTGFGSNPGNLRMFKYVPPGLPANAPLVVAMHGCSQSAASYDAETGWQMLAQRWQFALLLPQQQSANNSSTCFNWFEASDTARGSGEALSIKQMVDRMQVDHGGDPARVYVTGLSAGGAMVSVMMATYPEVFAGGAIVAGLPYRCATSQSAAFSCMNPGTDLTPAQWGDKVRAASSHTGAWPIVSIWHGDADYVVRPANLTESMQQWTNVHGIDQTADVSDTVGGFPHKVYKDAGGTPRVETYTITGMGHGTPVDPGTGETQCGTAGAYILDVNLCSSYYIGHFWSLDNLDGNAPTVSLTAPANGANLSGTVTVSAAASDDIGVDRVEFLLDGTLLDSDPSAPYSISWNSDTASTGNHALQARAFDLADNVGTSASVTVNVLEGSGGGTPLLVEFSNEDANDGYVKANADGSAPAVGTLEAYSGLALGRGTDGKFNRSVLSFDTSSLPDGATLVSATVTVAYRSASGNPWGNPAGNTLVVDVNNGCFGACVIETGDYAAAASASAVAQLLSFSGGSQTSNAFASAGLSAINRGGRTQLRLRFSGNPTSTNYLWIDKGATAKLRVEYLP